MPLQNPARVGIHDKNRKLAGVEQDGVGGFRANAMNGQEFVAQLLRSAFEHSVSEPS